MPSPSPRRSCSTSAASRKSSAVAKRDRRVRPYPNWTRLDRRRAHRRRAGTRTDPESLAAIFSAAALAITALLADAHRINSASRTRTSRGRARRFELPVAPRPTVLSPVMHCPCRTTLADRWAYQIADCEIQAGVEAIAAEACTSAPSAPIRRAEFVVPDLVERQATFAVLMRARRRGLSVLRLRQAM